MVLHRVIRYQPVFFSLSTYLFYLSVCVSIYLHIYFIYLYMAPSLKEIQKMYTKTSFFSFLQTLGRIYTIMYKHSLYIGLRKISTWNNVVSFFFLFLVKKKEQKILALRLKATIRSVEFGNGKHYAVAIIIIIIIVLFVVISRGNYQSQYSLFCTIPCFFRQSGQYHLPLGGTIIPTHSKWNHSMRQSSPSQAIISDTSSYGQRQ